MNTSNFHRKLIDNLSTAILVLNSDMTVTYMNPAAEMLLEVSGARVNGAHILDIFTEANDTTEALQNSLASGHPFTKREAEFQLFSGNRIRVDYTVSPVLNVSPPHLLMEIQARDRLIRISREEEILAKQETAKVLVRSLAHEVKNPLGGIRGAAQLLERELPDAELTEYTQIIISEADRLRNLVDRMLGPNKAFKEEPVNIHEVLERVISLIGVESAGKIRLVRDYDPSIPEFSGDKEQLIQAFLNIARNAMQALQQSPDVEHESITFRTRPLRQFTIGHTRHRLVLRVDVIDNGPGIPEQFIKDIFYPMISGRADGSGLGLSITQSIIGQHKGLVECESEPGLTNFIIFIPLERKV